MEQKTLDSIIAAVKTAYAIFKKEENQDISNFGATAYANEGNVVFTFEYISEDLHKELIDIDLEEEIGIPNVSSFTLELAPNAHVIVTTVELGVTILQLNALITIEYVTTLINGRICEKYNSAIALKNMQSDFTGTLKTINNWMNEA